WNVASMRSTTNCALFCRQWVTSDNPPACENPVRSTTSWGARKSVKKRSTWFACRLKISEKNQLATTAAAKTTVSRHVRIENFLELNESDSRLPDANNPQHT